eukprot:6282195-Alexandrium_andersonii.AAC.1
MAAAYSNTCRAFRSQKLPRCLRHSKVELRGPEPASESIPEALEGCALRLGVCCVGGDIGLAMRCLCASA